MEDDLPDSSDRDPDRERMRLLRSLKRAEGFSLFFLVCNNGETRNRLLSEYQAFLPDKRVQAVPVPEQTDDLPGYLSASLREEKPDVLFLYGLENWISGDVAPESIPLFAALNANRNSFGRAFAIPIVFSLPEYLLTAVMQAAPDFFSVRSGVFFFVRDDVERKLIIESLSVAGLTEAYALLPQEREERIRELKVLLEEYRSLPQEHRDYFAEARLLYQLVTNYIGQGDYYSAEPLLREVLSFIEATYGPDHPITATGLSYMAYIHFSYGRYKEAESLLKHAIGIDQKVYGLKHQETATNLGNLAVVYEKLGKYQEAESIYQQALEGHKSLIGSSYPGEALNLNNLAGLYRAQGKHQEAVHLYKQALSIYQSQPGNVQSYIADTLNNLAGVYLEQKDYQEAELLFNEALEIRQRLLGNDHPHIANSLNNLAGLYQKQGKYGQARSFFEQALKVFAQTLGPTHPSTVNVLNNLVVLQRKMTISRKPELPLTDLLNQAPKRKNSR